MQKHQAHSASLADPAYWWYRARSRLLRAGLGSHLPTGALTLDVGSADGASVDWIEQQGRRVPVDIDPTALGSGGVCASLLQLPFPDCSFDVVSAFDVLEHFPDEAEVLTEIRRVLRPGGKFLIAVPAYQWAWTSFDEAAGHYRRYTHRRLRRVLTDGGFRVDRCTYAFAFTFPFFVVDRAARRLRHGDGAALPGIPSLLERALIGLCWTESVLLRRLSMPFGSSVLGAAVRAA